MRLSTVGHEHAQTRGFLRQRNTVVLAIPRVVGLPFGNTLQYERSDHHSRCHRAKLDTFRRDFCFAMVKSTTRGRRGCSIHQRHCNNGTNQCSRAWRQEHALRDGNGGNSFFWMRDTKPLTLYPTSCFWIASDPAGRQDVRHTMIPTMVPHGAFSQQQQKSRPIVQIRQFCHNTVRRS